MVPFRGGARVDMEAMQMSILVADASKHVATTQRWGLSRDMTQGQDEDVAKTHRRPVRRTFNVLATGPDLG